MFRSSRWGVITSSRIHRTVVEVKGWMVSEAFVTFFALAQVAPGPTCVVTLTLHAGALRARWLRRRHFGSFRVLTMWLTRVGPLEPACLVSQVERASWPVPADSLAGGWLLTRRPPTGPATTREADGPVCAPQARPSPVALGTQRLSALSAWSEPLPRKGSDAAGGSGSCQGAGEPSLHDPPRRR